MAKSHKRKLIAIEDIGEKSDIKIAKKPSRQAKSAAKTTSKVVSKAIVKATAKPAVKVAVKPVKSAKPNPPARRNATAKNVDGVKPVKKPAKQTAAEVVIEELREEQAEQRKEQKKQVGAQRKQTKRAMPAILRVMLSLLLLIMVSAALTWFLVWRTNLCETEDAIKWIEKKPQLYTYDFWIILALLATVATITWKPFFTSALGFAAISIISYIHIQKYAVRAAPLLPEDFQMAGNAGNLMQFVDGWEVTRLVLGVILILMGAGLLEYCARRTLGGQRATRKWWEYYQIVPRTTMGLAGLAVLSVLSSPIINRKGAVWLDEMEYISWNQTENYEMNGFLVGFMLNLGVLEMEEPEGYTQERMEEIIQKYQTLKKNDDKNRKALDEVADNLIVILDETFYDPALLTRYYSHYGGDVTPNLHRIFQNYPSGYMSSPEYGGGTANVEFEVQTSLTNFWAVTTPYVTSVAKTDGLLGVADWARESGFETLAIHSYDGTMYKRNIVYPLIGYGEFVDKFKMKHTKQENDRGYISDKEIFQEVLDRLESSDDKKMISVVTMQNHGPYDSAGYEQLQFGLQTAVNYTLENNFQSLHNADKYLAEFLAKLDGLNQKTVVLWFGDHAAGVLDAYAKSEDENDQRLVHLTPYFIYANFEIESKYTEKEVAEMNTKIGIDLSSYGVKGIDLPTTSPNCLQNTLYDTLGIQKPALQYLVAEVCQDTPILTRAYWDDETPKMSTVLKEYELTSYDSLAGKQYWK